MESNKDTVKLLKSEIDHFNYSIKLNNDKIKNIINQKDGVKLKPILTEGHASKDKLKSKTSKSIQWIIRLQRLY